MIKLNQLIYGSDDDLVLYSKDNNLKDFTLNLLKEADILIKDFHVSYEEIDNNNLSFAKNRELSNVKIILEHEVVDKKNKRSTYTLNFNDESSGTKALFALAPSLQKAFTTPKVILVDELEKSMHPALVEFIIKLFNNKKINKVNS